MSRIKPTKVENGKMYYNTKDVQVSSWVTHITQDCSP